MISRAETVGKYTIPSYMFTFKEEKDDYMPGQYIPFLTFYLALIDQSHAWRNGNYGGWENDNIITFTNIFSENQTHLA